MAIKRPSVTRARVADLYHMPGERIMEFMFPDGTSGLISFRTDHDGRNVIDVGRVTSCDGARPNVHTLSNDGGRARAITELVDYFWDDDANDWRELQSCADAVEFVSLTIGKFTPEK